MKAPIRFTMDMIHDHDFLSLLEKADVVITKPTSPEWDEQLAFGKGALRRVVESQTAEELNVVWLLVDWSSEEPEALAAALLVTKGTEELSSAATEGGQ